jgi:transcriptional regulator NrdR family protein
MFCIKCFHPTTKVSNSRPHKKNASVWRRRVCPNCGHIFTTDERPRLSYSQQVWHPGSASSTSFNPGILLISIANAFGHDPAHGKRVAWDLTETVIQTLAIEHPQALSSEDVAAVTHQVLDRYDKKASLQYGLQHELLTARSTKRKK